MAEMVKKKIFIIDDQEEVLSLLKDSLIGCGFDVVVCKEPKNSLNLIKTFKPGLVLLDLLMPGLSGFEVC